MCYYIRNDIWHCWGSNTHGENDVGYDTTNRKIYTASIGRNYLCLIYVKILEFRNQDSKGGKLVCYGNNSHKQLDVPRQPVNFHIDTILVSAGDWHTCALKYDGLVGCWGYNSKGQTDVSGYKDEVVNLVSVKNESTCLLIHLKLVCFGGLSLNEDYDRDNQFYAYLQMGYNHVCTFIYELKCYGDNEFGQINVPEYTIPGNIKADLIVSTDANHTCALNGGGQLNLDCFGQDDENQLVKEPPITTWMEVVTGAKHTCALYIHFYVQCWGTDTYALATIPPLIHNYVHKFSVGGFFSCFLRNANVSCLGKTNKGKITDVPQYFYKRTEEVSAGYNHVCACYLSIKYARTIIDCWGLKDKDSDIIKPPLSVYRADYNFIAQIRSGYKFSCVDLIRSSRDNVDHTDLLICWGLNTFGQHNVADELSAPNRTTHSLSLGVNHSCATSDIKDLFCWGSNQHGQTSIPLSARRGVMRVSAGSYHTCASTYESVCWGLNNFGQASVPRDAILTYVVAGSSHSCGFDNKRRMRCFGSNKYKQLTVPKNYYSNAREFGLGERHTCAINAEGQYTCWGDDEHGQVNQGKIN